MKPLLAVLILAFAPCLAAASDYCHQVSTGLSVELPAGARISAISTGLRLFSVANSACGAVETFSRFLPLGSSAGVSFAVDSVNSCGQVVRTWHHARVIAGRTVRVRVGGASSHAGYASGGYSSGY